MNGNNKRQSQSHFILKSLRLLSDNSECLCQQEQSSARHDSSCRLTYFA
jgi:hypothetical protein